MKISFNQFKTAFKFTIGFSLLYWLYVNGSFENIHLISAINSPLNLVLAICLLIIQIFFVTWRWKEILSIENKTPIKFSDLLAMTWIGAFFSTVLPGGVGGDLVRINYAKKYDKQYSNKFLLFSIVLDRLFGLGGLIVLSFLTYLINFKSLTQTPETLMLFWVNSLLFLGIVLLVGLFIIFHRYQLLKHLKKIPKIGLKTHTAIEKIMMTEGKKKFFMKMLLVSIFCHLLVICAFWILVQGAEKTSHVSFTNLAAIAPLGFIVVTLPISPAGLGVGHLAFEKLFLLFGIKNGASLFNIYWIVAVIINILGFIPFMFHRQKSDTFN